MRNVLIISSWVSASYVGARANALCLQQQGINAIILPTTLFGRHPGWGAPGGDITHPALLNQMWQAIQAQNIHFDGLLSGYMGCVEHIDLSYEIITKLRHIQPELYCLIDPVMGDHGQLYVDETVAQKLKSTLLPLADIISPNLWEFEYICAQTVNSLTECIVCARDYLPTTPCLISSVTQSPQTDLTTLYIDAQNCHSVSHRQYPHIPHGTGDCLSALFLAHRFHGLTPAQALAQSTTQVFALSQKSYEHNLPELPLLTLEDAHHPLPFLTTTPHS